MSDVTLLWHWWHFQGFPLSTTRKATPTGRSHPWSVLKVIRVKSQNINTNSNLKIIQKRKLQLRLRLLLLLLLHQEAASSTLMTPIISLSILLSWVEMREGMQAPWSDYNVSVDSNNNLVVNNGTDDTRNITVEMVYLLQFNSEPEQIKISLFRVNHCSSIALVERLTTIRMRIELRSGEVFEETVTSLHD